MQCQAEHTLKGTITKTMPFYLFSYNSNNRSWHTWATSAAFTPASQTYPKLVFILVIPDPDFPGELMELNVGERAGKEILQNSVGYRDANEQPLSVVASEDGD